MSRYIDAEKLVERVKAQNMGNYSLDIRDCVLDLIRMQPTVDTATVVQCKDCSFWDKQSNSLQGRCVLSGNYPTGNWFCANGAQIERNE